ncbi:hypothetical protein HPB50_003322 [Hyalomma asiaticum]|uniref:Uncharacterized protein n=1 Tax=Hyalomma asiaticum TaxID=266040 RepID=A0ACB7T5F8_HYAAI|nr:hypothetical protein HPB50_003322 [Hyalomma asiaticum]
MDKLRPGWTAVRRNIAVTKTEGSHNTTLGRDLSVIGVHLIDTVTSSEGIMNPFLPKINQPADVLKKVSAQYGQLKISVLNTYLNVLLKSKYNRERYVTRGSLTQRRECREGISKSSASLSLPPFTSILAVGMDQLLDQTPLGPEVPADSDRLLPRRRRWKVALASDDLAEQLRAVRRAEGAA